MDDLASHTIIRVSSNPDYWELFTKYTREGTSSHARVLTSDSYFAAMSAAERGLGIAIGLFLLASSWGNVQTSCNTLSRGQG